MLSTKFFRVNLAIKPDCGCAEEDNIISAGRPSSSPEALFGERSFDSVRRIA